MEFLKEEEAQGATEYLLMLAAVLVIVGVAIYYVMQVRGTGGGTVENQLENIENNL